MQRVKDVLQSIFYLDICSFMTLSQLVCVNPTLYHTQLLFVLYLLMLPLGQPVPACVVRAHFPEIFLLRYGLCVLTSGILFILN